MEDVLSPPPPRRTLRSADPLEKILVDVRGGLVGEELAAEDAEVGDLLKRKRRRGRGPRDTEAEKVRAVHVE